MRTLREFWEAGHGDCEQQLRSWYADADKAQWKCPADIKARYATASFLANNRVVFNIGGNNYRLIVRINYSRGGVYIRFIGSHAEYDHIKAEEV